MYEAVFFVLSWLLNYVKYSWICHDSFLLLLWITASLVLFLWLPFPIADDILLLLCSGAFRSWLVVLWNLDYFKSSDYSQMWNWCLFQIPCLVGFSISLACKVFNHCASVSWLSVVNDWCLLHFHRFSCMICSFFFSFNSLKHILYPKKKEEKKKVDKMHINPAVSGRASVSIEEWLFFFFWE